MGVEATLAEAIGTTGVNAKYDAACKRLLSEKYILAWIMKSCLTEYQDCAIKEKIGRASCRERVLIQV